MVCKECDEHNISTLAISMKNACNRSVDLLLIQCLQLEECVEFIFGQMNPEVETPRAIEGGQIVHTLLVEKCLLSFLLLDVELSQSPVSR
jgi:hypothetical protein